MTATEEVEEIKKRKVLDTPGLKLFIAKVKKGDADERAALEAHKADHNNPHHVTAHQVGAYTQQETDDRISDALSGEVGGWLGNLTVAEVNALTTHKKGDSATMLDAGTVVPGNVTVDVGDDTCGLTRLPCGNRKYPTTFTTTRHLWVPGVQTTLLG